MQSMQRRTSTSGRSETVKRMRPNWRAYVSSRLWITMNVKRPSETPTMTRYIAKSEMRRASLAPRTEPCGSTDHRTANEHNSVGRR